MQCACIAHAGVSDAVVSSDCQHAPANSGHTDPRPGCDAPASPLTEADTRPHPLATATPATVQPCADATTQSAKAAGSQAVNSPPPAATTAAPQLPRPKAAAADATGPLPPTGSYYEYAGQRVLVPEWPERGVNHSQAISSHLSGIVRQVLSQQALRDKAFGAKILTEWAKEMLLRVKCSVAALETSDPEAYAEVGTEHIQMHGLRDTAYILLALTTLQSIP